MEEISGEGNHDHHHPYDFHVSGPRHVSSPNWRDLISSSWNDCNYRRIVISCFIQGVYLLELDRQENRTTENGLASKWWKPFKYKLSQTLIDQRDNSIFGAILEWDQTAALSSIILRKPAGAPRAVLALRGTLLKNPTIRRDLEDDLRFLAWESLKGSVRFTISLEALKSAIERFRSCNVCIAGHSLGAGFALQVGKALAKQGVFVESHLFNPPSVSLAMSLKIIGERADFVWKRFKAKFPSKAETHLLNSKEEMACDGEKVSEELKKWVPYLYVNNNDYICCNYTDRAGTTKAHHVGSASAADMAAKMFVMSNGPKKFLEAHGLQQWWSDDIELQLAVQNSKLVYRQLKSLYAG